MRVLTARAPTRIDFGGGWTDVPPYCTEQGGCVCNLAIARHASVVLREPAVRARAGDGTVARDARPRMETPPESTERLVAAALRHGGARGLSIELRNDFPVAAGLGGSSAAGVALQAALAAWRGDSPTREELAERSRTVEVEELGISGGRQDHYAAAVGGALALGFTDVVAVRRIQLSRALVAALECQCVVVYTGQSRISGDTIAAVLDAYRAGDRGVSSALARMRALAVDMIGALERGEVDELGALVAEHWEHQRALHPSITTPVIERVLHTARGAGALGGKALGASGGGCVVVIAPQERAPDVRAAVARVAAPLPFAIDENGVAVLEGEP